MQLDKITEIIEIHFLCSNGQNIFSRRYDSASIQFRFLRKIYDFSLILCVFFFCGKFAPQLHQKMFIPLPATIIFLNYVTAIGHCDVNCS